MILLLGGFFFFQHSLQAGGVVNDAYTYQDSFEDSSGIDLDQTTGFINTGGSMEVTAQNATTSSNCFSLPQPAGGAFQEWSFLDIEVQNLTDVTTNTLEVKDCSDNVLQTETLTEGINSFDLSSIPSSSAQIKLVYSVEHSATPGSGASASKLNFWKVFGKSQNITGLSITPNQTSIDNNSTITFNINLSSNGAITQNPVLNISLDDINGDGISPGLAQDATVCYDVNNNGVVENTAEECNFYRPLTFSSASRGPQGETPTTPTEGSRTGNITYNLNNIPDGYSGSATVTLKIPKGYVDGKTLKARARLAFGSVSGDGSFNNEQSVVSESGEVVVNGAINMIAGFGSQYGDLGPGATHIYDYGYIRNSLGSELNGADFENIEVTFTAADGSCVPNYAGYRIHQYSSTYPYTVVDEPTVGNPLNNSNSVILKIHRISYDRAQYGLLFDIPLSCSEGDIEISKAEIKKDGVFFQELQRTHNIIFNSCRRASWLTRRVMSGLEPGNDYIFWPRINTDDGAYLTNESLHPGEYFNNYLHGSGSNRTHTITLDHTYNLTEIPPGITFHGLRDDGWISAVYKDSDGDALLPTDPAFTHGNPESSGWHPVEMAWPGDPFSDAPDDNNSIAVAGPGTRLLIVKNDDNPAWVGPDNGALSSSLLFRTCDGSFGCAQKPEGSTISINSVSSKLYTYQTQVAPYVQECVSNMGSWTNYLEAKSWPGFLISSQNSQFQAGSNAQVILDPYNRNDASQYPQSTWGVNLYNLRDQINLTGLTGEVVLPTGGEYPHPDQNIAGESCNPANISFHIPDEATCLASSDPNSPDCFAYWEIPDACQLPNGWGRYSFDAPSTWYQSTYQLHLSAPILNTVPADTVLDFNAEVRTSDLSSLGADNAVDPARWAINNYTDTTSITVLASPALDVTQTAPSIWPTDNSFTYLTEVENQGNGPNNGIYSVTLLPKAGDSLGSTFTPDYQKAYFNLSEADIIAEYSTDSSCFSSPTGGTWNTLSLQATSRSGYQSETVGNIDPGTICLRTRIDNSSSYSLDPGDWLNTALDVYIPAETSEGEKLFSKSLAGANSAWGPSDLTPVETTINQTQVGYSVVLEIDKEYYSDPTRGRMIKWTLSYFNRSATPVTDIVLEDHLAPELIYQELEGELDSNESCLDSNCITDQDPDETGGTLTFLISNLEEDDGDPTGGSDQGIISFWTQIDPATPSRTTIENCANIIPGGLGIGDTTCSSLTTAALDITKSQTLSPDLGSNYAQIGVSTLHYTLSTQNQESFPVYFHFYDSFPEEATYRSGSLKINGATASDSLVTDQTLNHTLNSTTNPGETATVEFTLKTNSDLMQGDLIENQAFISYCTDLLDQATCSPALETNIAQAQALASSLTITPRPLIFAAQSKDTTSMRLFNLTNQEEAPVTFSSYSLVKGTVFAINPDQTTCAQDQILQKDESCQIEIAFAPNDYLAQTDQLSVQSNDTYNQTLTADIQGSTLIPDLAITPNPLNFGSQLISTSETRSITLQNTGGDDLTINSFALSSAEEGIYQLREETDCQEGQILPPEETCQVKIVFTPTQAKNYPDSYLTINSTHPTAPEITVSLTGKGEEEQRDHCDLDDLDVKDIEIQSITLTSALVTFRTNNKAEDKLYWGTNQNDLQNKEKHTRKERKHEVNLTNLTSGVTYYLRVEVEDECEEEDESKIYSFTTLTPSPSNPKEEETEIILTSIPIPETYQKEKKQAEEGQEQEEEKEPTNNQSSSLKTQITSSDQDQPPETLGKTGVIEKITQAAKPASNALAAAFAAISAALLFSSFTSLSQLKEALGNLLAIPFGRKNQPQGIVYDGQTGQPIPFAQVAILNPKGKALETKTTDKHGGYFFLVPKGEYQLSVHKKGYQQISEKYQDQLKVVYQNNYFPEQVLKIEKEDLINPSIPLKASQKNWSSVLVNKKLIHQIFEGLFYIGFALAILILVFNSNLYNSLVVLLYIFFFLLKVVNLSKPHWGVVYQKNIPQPFAVVSAKAKNQTTPLARVVTDQSGRYAFVLDKGVYSIETKLGSQTFRHTFTNPKRDIVGKRVEI